METTAKQVFDLAIKLMNENDDRTGATETQDTLEYKVRALDLMNVIRHELYPYSDTYRASDAGKRPICPEFKTLEQYVDLDDSIAQGIMPYGLAAKLIVDDNPTLANYFQQTYEQLIVTLGMRMPGVWEDIEPMYG